MTESIEEIAETGTFKMYKPDLSVESFIQDLVDVVEETHSDVTETELQHIETVLSTYEVRLTPVSVMVEIEGRDFLVEANQPFGTFYSRQPSVGEDDAEPISDDLFKAISHIPYDEDEITGSWSNTTEEMYERLDKHELQVFKGIRSSFVMQHLEMPQIAFLERAKEESNVELLVEL